MAVKEVFNCESVEDVVELLDTYTANAKVIAGGTDIIVAMKEKRIMLKLSGEALAGEKKTGFDEATVLEIARQVKVIHESGAEVGVVIGGGNFWRGRTSENMDRTKADQIGMLATIMNCLYVSEMFRSVGLETEILPLPEALYERIVFAEENLKKII